MKPKWTLPDGSVGCLRSRGLDLDELIAIIGQLTPRPADATINGFDYGADGPAGLELVAERMNTAPWGGTVAGSQCVLESTGSVLRVAMYTGDPTLMYAAVIDRAPPGDVGVVGESVIILLQFNTDGITTSDVVDADEDTWRRLLDFPRHQLRHHDPGDGRRRHRRALRADRLDVDPDRFAHPSRHRNRWRCVPRVVRIGCRDRRRSQVLEGRDRRTHSQPQRPSFPDPDKGSAELTSAARRSPSRSS